MDSVVCMSFKVSMSLGALRLQLCSINQHYAPLKLQIADQNHLVLINVTFQEKTGLVHIW